jgi:UDP-N-acetyl-D-mannosaminuronic acid dehydrogenase
MKYDLCIIGGAGHVGLPLGIAMAEKGVNTVLLDKNEEALDRIQNGAFPFMEEGGQESLGRALKNKKIFASTSPEVISESRVIVTVIGTPIDQYLNPDLKGVLGVCEDYLGYFKDGQIFVLRSTVYPGTTERVAQFFKDNKKKISVVFAPERIAQGKSLIELKQLPQIVAGADKKAVEKVKELFEKISVKTSIEAEPLEAELAKLITNAWRYISFAAANQFYMIANNHGVNYHKVHDLMTKDYPRNKNLPTPGFAAGPCLLKDTVQLISYNDNNFLLGYNAMMVNEGLPNYLVQDIKKRAGGDGKLKHKTIGILGMAFKADNDDKRDSLSYKLKKFAAVEAKQVFCSDPYIKDSRFVSPAELIAKSDIIILGCPHSEYQKLSPKLFKNKMLVDIWNFFKA